jgi:hypothetical protein
MASQEDFFDTLCKVCEGLVDGFSKHHLHEGFTWDRHNVATLRMSAEMGCHLCTLLWQGIIIGEKTTDIHHE